MTLNTKMHFRNNKEIKQVLDTLTLYNKDLLDRSISNNFDFIPVISSPLLQKGKYE